MAFVYKNYGYASALSFALFIVIMIFTVVFTLLTNKTEVKEFIQRRKENKMRKKELGLLKGSAADE